MPALLEASSPAEARIGPIPPAVVSGVAGTLLVALIVISRLHPAPEEG